MGDFDYLMLTRENGKKVGAHSITFNGINTWDRWKMAPKSRPFVVAPNVKTEYIDVPGADGALDYTEALTGKPRYNNRTGSWTFLVDNGYREWYDLYSDILAKLHGKYFDEIILEDDPEYKWKGRLFVSGSFGNQDFSAVTIQYNLDPYKRPIDSSEIKNWKWSDLFGNTIMYGGFSVNGEKVHNIYNNTEDAVTCTVTTTNAIRYYICENGESDIQPMIEAGFRGYSEHWLATGENDVTLPEGDNVFFFVGNAYVKFSYERGGIL